MSLNISSFSRFAVTFLKDQVLPTLTEKQKKIAIVVALAFSCLALLYFTCKKLCCRTKKLDIQSDDQDTDKNKANAKKWIVSPLPSPEIPKKETDRVSPVKIAKNDLNAKNETDQASPAKQISPVKIAQDDPNAKKSADLAQAKIARKLMTDPLSISLREYRYMSAQQQQEFEDHFKKINPQRLCIIYSIGQDLFFQKIKQLSDQVLELVNLSDLFVDLEQSKIKYALLNDAEFEKLTSNAIEEATREQKQFILNRLNFIKKLDPCVLPQNIADLNFVQFVSLSSKEINDVITKITPSFFCLLSDAQMSGLNYALATAKQIQNLFSGMISTQEDKRRFAFLPNAQVNLILDKLDEYQMYLLSDEHLRHLDASKLSVNHLKLLFSGRNGTSEDKRRFALLFPAQVNLILDKLNDYQMYLLTDKHLQNLDVSNLSEKQLKLLFSVSVK